MYTSFQNFGSHIADCINQEGTKQRCAAVKLQHLFMGQLTAKPHKAHCSGGGEENILWIGADKTAEETREHAAGAGDFGHQRMTVINNKSLFVIGDNIDGAGDAQRRYSEGSAIAQSDILIEAALMNRIGNVGIHPWTEAF